MIWTSKNSTYYDKGKKAYGYCDKIPEKVLEGMGKETLEEYMEKGLISDVAVVEPDVIDKDEAIPEKIEPLRSEEEVAETEPEIGEEAYAKETRQALIERAKFYGLKPHPKTGIAKLKIMIEDYEALNESDS